MQYFDEYAAQTKHQHWSELFVTQTTDNYFMSICKFLDAYSKNPCCGLFGVHPGHHFLKRYSNLSW